MKAFLYLLLNLHVGIATNFSPTDKFNPNPELYCRPGHDLNYTDLVVAHKHYPCGTKIFLYNPRNKRYSYATVQDRGRLRVATFDLSPAVTKALRANGMETIIYVPLEN